MNDLNRFIWDVDALPPAQAGSWGWPDLDIEEIRLDRGTSYERFLAGVGAAIEPAKTPYDATSLESHLYHDLTYSVAHTLPFVCDQVLTYPKQSGLMFVGARADFLRRFSTAWRGMGFTGPILVPQECAGLPIDGPGVETGPFAELLRRAEMFIFEFGLATQRDDEPVRTGRKITPADDACLKVVESLFRQTGSLEAETRPEGQRLPRRVIGVNVIYNCYWPLFTEYIGANINPFCSRVLAGNPRPATSMKGKIARLRNRLHARAPSSARLTMAADKLLHRAAIGIHAPCPDIACSRLCFYPAQPFKGDLVRHDRRNLDDGGVRSPVLDAGDHRELRDCARFPGFRAGSGRRLPSGFRIGNAFHAVSIDDRSVLPSIVGALGPPRRIARLQVTAQLLVESERPDGCRIESETAIPGREPIELVSFYEEFRDYYAQCELETKRWFVEHVRPDWWIFDVGANVGYYTILFARLAPRGRVLCVRTDGNGGMLRVQSRHHNVQNAEVHEVALGATTAKSRTGFTGCGAARVEKDLSLHKLDDFVDRHRIERVDCIKIDVDSFDFDVLRGAEQTLLRRNPVVRRRIERCACQTQLTCGEALCLAGATWLSKALVLDHENFVLQRGADAFPELSGHTSLELLFPRRVRPTKE
jgi:FkbM family methyltransferase